MAKRRKPSAVEIIGATVLVVFMLLQAIPKEAWIGVAILAVLGVLVYLYSQSKKSPPTTDDIKMTGKIPRTRTSARRSSEDHTPVSVASSSSKSGFKLPLAPKGFGEAKWFPAGESVSVAGIDIPGGLIYVGKSLKTPNGDNDPCLIDPSKSVARQGDYTVRQMGYWPSYSDISSSARRAYLNWLAGGRKDHEADIGYVFLFFYGLERRAIIDGSKDEAAQAELPTIAIELRRLLNIYGGRSNSFRRYAGELLDLVSLSEHASKLYERSVPVFPKTYELPLYVRLALGQAAVDAVPVPVHLALSWAKLDPNIQLRTPATRCSEQFDQLFSQHYAETFDLGMILPRNRTKLKMVYRPASAGFRDYSEIKLTFKDTPDVTVLTAPIKILQEVVDAATKQLEPYSRLVGKNPEAKLSIEGLLLLPAPLWPESAQKSLLELKSRMGEGMVDLTFQALLSELGAKSTFTKDRILSLARTLESANIGFEPDVLSGSKPPKPEDRIVLFLLPAADSLSRASGPYLIAALTLQLAAAVAFADGEFDTKEIAHLRETVLSWKHLPPSQTCRLLAQLHMLSHIPISLTVLKKKFEPLTPAIKETIAAFMATVAQSDGEVSPAEVKMLEKIYKAIGVDSKRVFSDVHAVASDKKGTAAIITEAGFKLDPARIAALQRDTEKVSELLANIFTDSEEITPIVTPESEAVIETNEAPKGILNLDVTHTALARMLLSRPEWSREELLDVAADLELMLDGSLEHINEAAFDMYDIPFLEGEDPVTVNAEILEKIEA
jgi:uncharacterized tellurite resistance protein B-like protein